MNERQEAIARFLGAAGWGSAERRPLAGDASARRYERLAAGTRTAVLMDAPPEPGEAQRDSSGAVRASGYSGQARLAVDCTPFVAIASHLRAAGFSAPAIYAHDIRRGLLLLEDLGDDLYVRLLGETGSGSAEPALYGAAVDLLAALHAGAASDRLSLPDGATYRVPAYEPSVYQVEADLLIDWYLPALTGAPLDPETRRRYHAAWSKVWPALADAPRHLCLRDFHAGNLLWLSARAGVGRVGLLDFQDGLMGPAAYDLVSLLQDARRDVPPALEAAMIDRYVGAARGRPGFDEASFRLAYAILGVQRNAKIVGIFTRLSRRDGKPVYLRHLPRVWGYLTAGLAHPALASLRSWFDGAVPPEARGHAPTPSDPRFGPLQREAS